MQVQNPTSLAPVAPLESHGLYRAGLIYGRQIYRIRWLVIALWLVALIVSVPFASKVASVLSGGGYTFSGSDSVRVANILTDKLHQPPVQAIVVFQSATTPVSAPGYQREVSDFISRAKTFAHVTSVASGGTGQDGRTTYVTVDFNQNSDTVEQQLPSFHKLLPGTAAGPARAYLTGDTAVYSAFTQISQQDIEHADATALPIALAVLLVVFGTLVAALTPLVLALVAVPLALAIIYVIALHTTTNVAVLSIASIVGLGISIDSSLDLTRRFREELARDEVREAVAWTVATAGEAILFSAMTVIIGFIGLLLIGVPYMTSIGVAGAVVVCAAMLAALTLLPALLSVLGRRVNALRLPLLSRFVANGGPTTGRSEHVLPQRTQRAAEEVDSSNRRPRRSPVGTIFGGGVTEGAHDERHGFWHTWAMAVMQRPIPIILVVMALLLGLGWPVLKMNIGIPTASALPQTAEARQGLDILQAQFPATNQNPIEIIAQAPDGSSMLTAENLAKLDHLTRWLAAQPHVTGVTSLTAPTGRPEAGATGQEQLVALYSSGAYRQDPALAQFVAATTAGNTTLITATTNAPLNSDTGNTLIDSLRAGDKAAGQGLTVLVGGLQAVTLDFDRYLYGNFPRAIAFILVATFVLLMIMFRSLLLPLKAVVVNVLSISASYGVLVYVFQWGHLQHLLGFTSEGFIESPIPILMFCVLFGLSMDYEVFLLSRIREEWLRTYDNRYAVARGLEKTGGVITNAALILMIVTGAITFTTLVSTKEIGLGMTIAVFVDATIIRSLLVPATMRLLGRWNWWLPGFPVPAKQ
jgi:RND superfamily putative drug exporter